MGKRKQSATRMPTFGGLCLGLSGEVFAEAEKAREKRERLWEQVARTQPEIAAWRNLAIRGILQDKVAEASYFKLLRSGFTQTQFLPLLAGMAVLIRTRGKMPAWLSGSGMTPKQIAYLPKRLCGLAGEIERLNKHPWLRPDVWVRARPKLSKPGKETFSVWLPRLPFLLRLYAAFLSGHTKDLRRFLRDQNRTAPRTQVLRSLIRFVREQTGKPMYADLSNVLTASARAARMTERGLDPDSLKRLDAVRRKREKPATAA